MSFVGEAGGGRGEAGGGGGELFFWEAEVEGRADGRGRG